MLRTHSTKCEKLPQTMIGVFSMMKRMMMFTASLSVLGILGGCTNFPTNTAKNNYLTSARPVVNQPVVMPTLPSRANFRLAYGNSPALSRAYQQYLRTGKAPNIVMDGFEQFAYGASQPVIAASPFELTVISLEAGENVTNVSSGDPLRWSYSMAYSGQGKNRQPHIMIKPSAPDISTDLVITTDKRMYTLKLVSSNGKYQKDVRFWYPDEIQSFWDNYNASQSQKQEQPDNIAEMPNVNLNQMNFDYDISASFFSPPSWKPTRIFDDGTHTYIQFPQIISNRDMPALFVVNNNNQELVNYRSKPPYFVVDKIFKQAVLIVGVGHNQTRVTITNNRYS